MNSSQLDPSVIWRLGWACLDLEEDAQSESAEGLVVRCPAPHCRRSGTIAGAAACPAVPGSVVCATQSAGISGSPRLLVDLPTSASSSSHALSTAPLLCHSRAEACHSDGAGFEEAVTGQNGADTFSW